MKWTIENICGNCVSITDKYSNYDIGLSLLNFKRLAESFYGIEKLRVEYIDHLHRKINVPGESVSILGGEVKKYLESCKDGFYAQEQISKIYFDWVAKYSNNYANPNAKAVQIKTDEKPILRPAKEIREEQLKKLQESNISNILDKIAEAIEKHIKTSLVPVMQFTDQSLIEEKINVEVYLNLHRLGYRVEVGYKNSPTLNISW